MKRFRVNLGNIALLGATLLGMFLLFEHVIFRYVLPTSDVLPNVSLNNVVRYLPGTRATFYAPDGHVSHVQINADGWNSQWPSYPVERRPGYLRIAVIGDSYVQASQVDTDEAFPAVLARELNKTLAQQGLQAEVLRFAVDGAPLSQYLHMLRREVLKYRPDVVVVQLIHNDFDESYRFLRGRYTSSFMKVIPEEDGRIREVPPEDFRPGLADALRNLRSFRYFYYQTGLVHKVKGLVDRYFWGGNEYFGDADMISSAVDIRAVRDHAKIRAVTGYVFAEMKRLSQEHDFQLLFAMDGLREAVYSGRPRNAYEVGRLNDLVGTLAKAQKLNFLDLQETFDADYKRRKKRFEFSWDWHWNELGHRLVGQAIAQRILALPGLLPVRKRPHPRLSRNSAGD